MFLIRCVSIRLTLSRLFASYLSSFDFRKALQFTGGRPWSRSGRKGSSFLATTREENRSAIALSHHNLTRGGVLMSLLLSRQLFAPRGTKQSRLRSYFPGGPSG